jgi:MoaA/NifB/PqqE/SkfB family radical SAM enzyme
MGKYNRFEKYKILFHASKLDALARGFMVDPVLWYIYPSNVCPFNCGHCIMATERADGLMIPEEVLNKIPVDAKEHRISTVIFSGGGEPLSNPFTQQTARECRRLGINTGLNTNGALIDELTADSFDFIRVSVDAATPSTYRSVHGVDLFGHVEENLMAMSMHGRRPEFGLAFLVTDENYDEIELFCEWAQKFNPSYIHIRPAYFNDDRMRRFHYSMEQKKNKVESKYGNVYFRMDKFDGHWTPKEYSKCRSTPLIAVLTASCQFSVCQDVFIKFGDYSVQSFDDIWYSNEHNEAINMIDLEKCPRCVEVGYNEIIEHVIMKDGLRRDII